MKSTLAGRAAKIRRNLTSLKLALGKRRRLIKRLSDPLAENWNGKLVALIVSGFDGDGADALCAIREVGGVTIAQKLETAAQPDMPGSAIASGCVDFVFSPEDIAAEIARIAQRDARDIVQLARD